MNDYIKKWVDIIENMNNDNTYKLAWGRAIIELAMETSAVNKEIVFTFEMIAHKMIKYYWNQIFFFNLKQSSNNAKPPVLVQNVNKLIDRYKTFSNKTYPEWFDKAEVVLYEDATFYNGMILASARKLKDDVSWRFMNMKGEKIPLYNINEKCLTISLKAEEIMDLKEFGFLLSQLLNYKWAQLLEKYNNSPRVASKVKGISSSTLRRNSLTKYKKILLKNDNYSPLDFYTGKPLEENDISVDHVIPWSFMYSDDIWNLVLTSQSQNSSKGNSIPNEDIIKKLKERNVNMVHRIDDEKMVYDLNYSISNNYIDKFYLAMKL